MKHRRILAAIAALALYLPAIAAEAHKRGIPLDPFTKHEPLAGNLRAQFRRVVDIGARLTAQHDPETLARFIVDEFVEMSDRHLHFCCPWQWIFHNLTAPRIYVEKDEQG